MSLYEEMGGKPIIEQMIDYFYAQVLLDPELKPYFKDIDMKRLRSHQVQFISAIAGGPAYKGRPIKEAHAGMKITSAAFDRVANHLVGAIDYFKLPAKYKQPLLNAITSMADDIIEV